MSENVGAVVDTNFETEVLQSSLPVLVDFWAEWCGPCRMLSPVVDEVAKEYSGKIKVLKMNVDESNLTSAKLGVRAIPTLIIFKNGQAVARKAGQMTKPQLASFIDSNL